MDIINESFKNQIISTVFLVGDTFAEGWMKQSVALLCKGRRVFMGNNLFTKGACYAAARGIGKQNGLLYIWARMR